MNKNIWLLLSSKWISNFGTHLHALVFPLIVYNQTQSVALLSLAFIAETLPWLLIGPIAPYFLKQRMTAKSILVMCDFLRFLIILGIIHFIADSWIILCLIFILGILNSIYSSFCTSIVKTNTTDLTLGTTLGISLGVDDMISLIAPALGAVLISAGVSPPLLLLVDSLTYLLSVFLLLGIKSEDNSDYAIEDTSPNFLNQITEGFKIIWNNLELRWLVTIEGIRCLVEGISIPLLMLYVAQVLSSSDSTFTWSRAISAACAILASFIFIKLNNQISKQKLVKIGTLFLIVSMLLISVVHEIYIFFAASALLGIGMALRQLVSENLLIQVTQADKLAEVASAYNAAISSFYLIGYGLSVIQQKGIPIPWFFTIGAFLLIMGSFLSNSMKITREVNYDADAKI
jgi:predicted MFS family arabinose efflux permease